MLKEVEAGKVNYPLYSQSHSASALLMHKLDVTTNTPADYVYLAGKLVAKVTGTPSAQAPLSPSEITLPDTSSTGSYTVSWPASTGATKPDFNVMVEPLFHDIGFSSFEKSDKWALYINASNFNSLKLKFCDGVLCEMQRHRK